MARPLPDQFASVWTTAFSGALVSLEEPDEVKARAQVDQAWKVADEALREFAARSLISEARFVVQERERRESWAKRQAEENERIEREGRKALRKQFGADIEAAVTDLHASYGIVRFRDRTLAVLAGQLDPVRGALSRNGVLLDETGTLVRGYRLAGATKQLSAVLNTAEEASRYVFAVIEQHRAEEAEQTAQKAAALQAEQEAKAHLDEFGVRPG